MKTKAIIFGLALLTMMGCKSPQNRQQGGSIDQEAIDQLVVKADAQFGQANHDAFKTGATQVAALWQPQDGSASDYEAFCLANFKSTPEGRDTLFLSLQRGFEVLWGNFNKMSTELMLPLHLDNGPVTPIDEMFGGYSPSANLANDLYSNKLAFITILNFPNFTLAQKSEMAEKWSPRQWAYARMGDVFTARVPAALNLKASEVMTQADTYISGYNIFMDKLVDDKGKSLFPEGMKLITHWGLRDELKSNYNTEGGLEKQKMIYQVMQRIIDQSIPKEVINQGTCSWNPYTNEIMKEGKKVTANAETDGRYAHLLGVFQSLKAQDPYFPQAPTYIQRKFDGEMEISQPEVEKLFTDFVSDPLVAKVGALISQRLGRPLQPFDIWYDGFKSRSGIPQEKLDGVTRAKYPNTAAVQADLPNILLKLGFKPEEATFITSNVQVDASRGAGHALGAMMKSDKARLRTRIAATGMDYKGYNIAVHEFGHNVEQTLSLHRVSDYMMNGVPNTAFTEALAFIFQKRDLMLLGMQETNPEKESLEALDNFWANYEIMGVSLVDMAVWKWLYENPNATAAQLRDQVMVIAKDVWNKYYAPVFGVKDQTILAIYSHMIDAPLYLSAYPIGHLIDFQIEQYLSGKDFATEVTRIYSMGRLVPQEWMRRAVGGPISIKPIQEATRKALEIVGSAK
ncbi:MAG: hypothetical protein LWX70_02430 [Sphingobacteriia bacterium]|nr:hypothetical protein [Sphingobacteriia bacterium]